MIRCVVMMWCDACLPATCAPLAQVESTCAGFNVSTAYQYCDTSLTLASCKGEGWGSGGGFYIHD